MIAPAWRPVCAFKIELLKGKLERNVTVSVTSGAAAGDFLMNEKLRYQGSSTRHQAIDTTSAPHGNNQTGNGQHMHIEPEVKTCLLGLNDATHECESLEMLPRTRTHGGKIDFPDSCG